jgi:hypothetical protein
MIADRRFVRAGALAAMAACAAAGMSPGASAGGEVPVPIGSGKWVDRHATAAMAGPGHPKPGQTRQCRQSSSLIPCSFSGSGGGQKMAIPANLRAHGKPASQEEPNNAYLKGVQFRATHRHGRHDLNTVRELFSHTAI